MFVGKGAGCAPGFQGDLVAADYAAQGCPTGIERRGEAAVIDFVGGGDACNRDRCPGNQQGAGDAAPVAEIVNGGDHGKLAGSGGRGCRAVIGDLHIQPGGIGGDRGRLGGAIIGVLQAAQGDDGRLFIVCQVEIYSRGPCRAGCYGIWAAGAAVGCHSQAGGAAGDDGRIGHRVCTGAGGWPAEGDHPSIQRLAGVVGRYPQRKRLGKGGVNHGALLVAAGYCQVETL